MREKKADKNVVAEPALTPEIIQSWKDKFPQCNFFRRPKTPTEPELLFHTITRRLWNQIKEDVDSKRRNRMPIDTHEIDLRIIRECVVVPKITDALLDNMGVGAPGSISVLIQNRSGFSLMDVQGRVLGPDVLSIPINRTSFWDEPTTEQMEELKASNDNLTRLIVNQFSFYVRPLKRRDEREVLLSEDPALARCRVVTAWPVLTPDEWENVPAGIIEEAANAIQEMSGYNSQVEIEEV